MSSGREVAKREAGKAKAPAIVAAIKRPGLELFGAHRGNLDLGWEYDDYDDAGKLVTRRWPAGEVNEYTKLVPEDECRALIVELDAALGPATYDQAKALTRTVMGRYAKRDLYDPDIFVFELTRVFAEAPADLGREASDRLRTRIFLANVGDVKGVLDGLVAERENARAQARHHLAEHERRRAEAAKPEPVPATREEIAAILEKHGHQKMVDEAAAEKAKAKPRHPIHDRAAAAAMETFRRQRGETAPAAEEQGAEAG